MKNKKQKQAKKTVNTLLSVSNFDPHAVQEVPAVTASQEVLICCFCGIDKNKTKSFACGIDTPAFLGDDSHYWVKK